MDMVRVGFIGLGMRGPGGYNVLPTFPVLRLKLSVIYTPNALTKRRKFWEKPDFPKLLVRHSISIVVTK
ncbi:MAG TPA: hypothetical protein DDZ57_00935 [Porphyromonadaceae bacterium]|nr:hypothetical protein [Porphyromonadaceae bacterium]HCF81410.1 hypothetical protein [Porphyromonadaceae bacterium]